MEPTKKVGVAAVVTAALVASLFLAKLESEKVELACVIPACADGGKEEVDCLRWTPAFLDKPAEYRWFGCNAFPKEEAKGTQCLPSPCVTADLKKPRELK